ncbi:hypothetical protein NSK_005163 [Nannochloropsis salina CCMP1776]|uniref:Uncharacterized protein n=1 Tax=Nannochloropsis salina CCMP1776 TaxID=1027361 RepID=A0A4D9CX33_9STRA|nr:hypothetical protein NSK_005163 [Nannochloropsis salina CCMP1776]|eukprot:TFJ83516.1 hypothetical protein NSK_005163 [Nannochloropsis salina CCMP1776]
MKKAFFALTRLHLRSLLVLVGLLQSIRALGPSAPPYCLPRTFPPVLFQQSPALSPPHSHASSSSSSSCSSRCPHDARRPSRLSQRKAPPAHLALRSGPLLDYDMVHVAGDVVAGFVGGAVGVMGTIMALEVKMRQEEEGGEEGEEGEEEAEEEEEEGVSSS